MRTRLILAAVCMLSLPLWFSPSPGKGPQNQVPFAASAFAGHVLSGGWCECGAPGCICDPGEEPTYQGSRAATGENETPSDQSGPGAEPGLEFVFGSGGLLLTLALFMWSKLRA